MNPYQFIKLSKQECTTHVTKRLGKHLKKIKNNTKNHTYIQHHLTEDKANYISSNYSTVVFQNRGKSADSISQALWILVSHVAGDHNKCPDGSASWCRWKLAETTGSIAPPAVTNFSTLEIAKVEETFQLFAIEFCSHLTHGLNQNANESLHNTIWSLIPKSRYVSPQSIRVSVKFAILIFNEGEAFIYKLMAELGLNPSENIYFKAMNRENERRRNASRQVGANVQRRRRRLRNMKLHRERDIQKKEGGPSYLSSSFGSESSVGIYSGPSSSRGRRTSLRGTRKVVTRGKTSITAREERNIVSVSSLRSKRSLFSSSDESPGYHSSVEDISSPSDVSEDDKTCYLCDLEYHPVLNKRQIGRKESVDWLRCVRCSGWWHFYCVDESRVKDRNQWICEVCPQK